MNGRAVYVEHEARTLARIAGVAAPHCDGLIVRHGQLDDVLAATLRRNPLHASWLIDVDLPGERIVTWSGSLAEEMDETHPLNWLRHGRETLEQFCRDVGPQLERHGRRLCFQPHHLHVLNDAPSVMSFLKAQEGMPFEIAFAPASLIVPSMLHALEDHLVRLFESLGNLCAMVVLQDVRVTQDAAEERCQAVPLGQGVLPRELVLRLLSDHVSAEVPLVIHANSLTAQLDWLGAKR